MSQLLTRRIGGKKTIEGASKTFAVLAKQAEIGVFKHKTHSYEVNFNGAEAEKVKESMAVDAAVSIMGESNKALVASLRDRICGSKKLENEDDSICNFFSISIKLKESFTDKSKLCEAINSSWMMEAAMAHMKEEKEANMSLNFSYVDGRMYIRGYLNS